MIYFKACPKCRGDMHIAEDSYGSFRKCIQCGFIQDVELQHPARAPASSVRKVA